MVDIPSRSRASPSSNTMVNVHRPYYASDSPRSPPRCRSPHRNSRSSESPPSLQSKYEDQDSIPIVEPGAFVIKQESAGLKSDAVSHKFFVITVPCQCISRIKRIRDCYS